MNDLDKDRKPWEDSPTGPPPKEEGKTIIVVQKTFTFDQVKKAFDWIKEKFKR